MKLSNQSLLGPSFRSNFFVSDAHKLIYIATPKAACTTLKWWFAALLGLTQQIIADARSRETHPDLVIHDLFPLVGPDATMLSPEETARRLEAGDYFRFAVVRNPYTRVFSAWQSKLLVGEPLQIGPYRDYAFLNQSITTEDDVAKAFEGFLEHLMNREAPNFWDPHWTPQVALLYPEHIHYTQLVQVENTTRLSEALAKYLGPSVPDPFASKRANESLIPFSPAFLTRRSANLIQSLYAEDFAAFNYGVAPPKPRRHIEPGEVRAALKAMGLIRGRNQRLDETRKSLSHELNALRGDTAAIRLENETFKEHNRKQLEENAYLRQGKEQLESNLSALKQIVTSNDARIQEMQDALSERGERLAILRQDVLEKESELARMRENEGRREELLSVLHQNIAERDRELTRLREAVEQHGEQLTALSQNVFDRDIELVRLRETTEHRKEQLAALRQNFVEKETELTRLRETKGQLEERIANLRKTIVERDAEQTLLRQIADERGQQLMELDRSLDQRTRRVGALEYHAEEQDKLVTEFKQTVAELSKRLANYDGTLAQQTAGINHLQQLVEERHGQIVNLQLLSGAKETQISGLRDEIAAILASRSWRVTAPLRAFTTQVRRLLSRSGERSLTPPAHRSSAGVNLNDNLNISQAGTSTALPAETRDIIADFDATFYLRMYPDIAAAGTNPLEHYIQHGMREGRLRRAPELELIGSFDSLDRGRETVMIVNHEASLTGAPVLGLNLVWELSKRYNVVAVLLGKGAIEPSFCDSAAVVVKAHAARGSAILAELQLEPLLQRHKIDFAIVNSIECRSILPVLAKADVPIISLIHEFASYTRPKDAFSEALLWSGQLVFSAGITLDNARGEFPHLNWDKARVLPQGRCIVPKAGVDAKRQELDRGRILETFRPDGDDDALVVLGAGFVQLRKGVELFIECAARVAMAPGGGRFRFVWIGAGYDPLQDVQYSVYLADQIRRAGLENSIFFLGETHAIETAYEEADMLLLSSRLDPLPNVAIDAMAFGLPTLCFDKTTGIAEVLHKGGLGAQSVARFLDTGDMADKILALGQSKELRDTIGEQCRALSLRYFDMSTYVQSLEQISKDIRTRLRQERQDAQLIAESGVLRKDFYVSPHWAPSGDNEVIRRYLRSWATGCSCRKPFPGFHPGLYRDHHELLNPEADPLADYMRAGCPGGPWSQRVITPRKECDVAASSDARVALHLHVYYPDLLREMLVRLEMNESMPDLFISVPNEEARKAVVESTANFVGRVKEIAVVPNRGRDIGPFLTEFGRRFLTSYDIVGHLHTKASMDLGSPEFAHSWYIFLLENLLGGISGGAMMDTIVTQMWAESSIDLVFPDDPHVLGWGQNRRYAEDLMKKLPMKELPQSLNFPVGTMFWARVSKLKPLIELGLNWEDYPPEPLPYDGSLLHAIERLIPLLGKSDSSCHAVTNVPGLTR